MITNPSANAGDIRETGLILGSGRTLEEGLDTHSSILAWRTHGQRAIVHRVAKSDTTEGT